MHRILICGLLFLSATGLFATNIGANTPVCPTASLAFYLANYGPTLSGGSCVIGQLEFAKFEWAAFNVLSNNQQTTVYETIKPSDLQVVPVAIRNSFDLIPFNVSILNRTIEPGEWERYFLTYNADPPPIIAGDELYLDPPTGPVFGTKWICADSPFSNLPGGQSIMQYVPGLSRASYSDTTFTCGVNKTPSFLIKTDGDPNTPTPVQASVQFPSLAGYINVRLILDFENGTTTGFEGIQVPIFTSIPEPGSYVLMGSALAGLGALLRRKRNR